MSEHILIGMAASPGVAAGPARVLLARRREEIEIPPAGRPAEEATATRALDCAAEELRQLAGELRAGGRTEEADIVEAEALMAADPALLASVLAVIRERGAPAATALEQAAEAHAAVLAALDDARLAARAADVRGVGRRAARLADQDAAVASVAAERPVVLVADDLGPAEVAELGADVAAVALASGGVTAHAAIVARSLGVPMAVGLGPELLAATEGAEIVVDGGAGSVVLDPDGERVAAASAAAGRRSRTQAASAARRALPAVTTDGRELRVMTNAASTAELATGLEAGAEGAGLIRTELAFLDADGWPTEADHRRALGPLLARLGGQTATVRVLDFGGDKTPPFLRGTRARGIALLLAAPDALAAQLRAILAAAGDAQVRILLPMVDRPVELMRARELLREAVDAVPGARSPALGAMVETPRGAAAAHQLAERADLLSIGTNDLTHTTLGSDRYGAGEAPTHHPRVLAAIARTIEAARRAGVPVEVCGEAASEALTMPLLVGLGADELSVGAARVGTVREWVRVLSQEEAAEAARLAVLAPDPETAAVLAAPLAQRLRLLDEAGEAAGELVDGESGVAALGPQA